MRDGLPYLRPCIATKNPSASWYGVVAGRPATGGGERHDRLGPAARGELQRHEAAQRVAGDVRGLEARLVHRLLDRVHGSVDGSTSPSIGGPPA